VGFFNDRKFGLRILFFVRYEYIYSNHQYLVLLEVSPCFTQAIFSFRRNLLPVLQLQLQVCNCSDTMANFYWTMRHSISKDFNNDFFVAFDDDLSTG
jgi:hypothetical protein